MRGSGFTPLEQTIMDSGEPDRVIKRKVALGEIDVVQVILFAAWRWAS